MIELLPQPAVGKWNIYIVSKLVPGPKLPSGPREWQRREQKLQKPLLDHEVVERKLKRGKKRRGLVVSFNTLVIVHWIFIHGKNHVRQLQR
jgi:hypothetical protein